MKSDWPVTYLWTGGLDGIHYSANWDESQSGMGFREAMDLLRSWDRLWRNYCGSYTTLSMYY